MSFAILKCVQAITTYRDTKTQGLRNAGIIIAGMTDNFKFVNSLFHNEITVAKIAKSPLDLARHLFYKLIRYGDDLAIS